MTEPTLTDKLLLLQMRQTHELLTAMSAVTHAMAFPHSAKSFAELANGAVANSGRFINEAQDLVDGADTEDSDEEDEGETEDWEEAVCVCCPPS